MEVVLDFRTFCDIEARTAEQRLDAQPRLGHRMQPAALLAAAGQRHIDAAGGQLRLDGRALKLRAARLDAPPAPALWPR